MRLAEVENGLAPKRWLSIVGIGEDGVEGLSAASRDFIAAAELVAGGARHLTLADSLINGERLEWPSPLEEAFPAILARRGRPVVVLASGDPFHYGVGKQLAALVPVGEFVCLPQPSAFSLAAARMGWSLQDAALVTLHGRPIEGAIPELQPGRRILALSWDGATPAKLQAFMTARGLGDSTITVLENMGGPRERIRSAPVASMDFTDISPLNTVAVEVAARPESRVIPLAPGLDDAFYENDGQLTKREIRALVLSTLAPRFGELLWDIGAGAGSISIEWLLADPSLRAIAIEEDAERAARARRNALELGAPNLEIVERRAPEALAGLVRPDAVFIGGGLSEPGVFETAWSALKSGGRLAANAVTLESEARLLTLHAAYGGELIRVSIARARPIGRRKGWRAAMPVTHWGVRKP